MSTPGQMLRLHFPQVQHHWSLHTFPLVKVTCCLAARKLALTAAQALTPVTYSA